jgi:carbonic anhydrase
MRKIIDGVRTFQSTVFREQRALFEALAGKPQKPLALFVTCSDSRINPNLITQTEPGELFLLRNAGNIIPAYGAAAASGGEGATVEYAVSVLRMPNVIVCGHYGCGAMHYLMRAGEQRHHRTDDLPSVRAWCAHAEATRRIVKAKHGHLPIERQDELAIERNVLVQLDNLRTHPSVAAALARSELSLYGWAYRIETGEVLAYDPVLAKFLPLTEVEEPPPHAVRPPQSRVVAS